MNAADPSSKEVVCWSLHCKAGKEYFQKNYILIPQILNYKYNTSISTSLLSRPVSSTSLFAPAPVATSAIFVF